KTPEVAVFRPTRHVVGAGDRRLRRRRLAGIAASVSLLLAGCGSTVGSSARTDAGLLPTGGAGNGLSAPTAVLQGPGSTGDSGGGFGGGSTSATTTDGSSTTTGGQPLPAEHGVTATTVTVGFLYHENSSALNDAAGATGIDNGDELAQEKALVADA